MEPERIGEWFRNYFVFLCLISITFAQKLLAGVLDKVSACAAA